MKRTNSRSTIFLTEVVLALTIFVLCSTVCISLFAIAYQDIQDSKNLNQAVFAAQELAEGLTAFVPQVSQSATIQLTSEPMHIYYDQDWQKTGSPDTFDLIYTVEQNSPYLYDLSIEVKEGDKFIYSLETSIYKPEVL